MGMTITEKILAAHSRKSAVYPGEIIDVTIDARVARDFGGANVVKNIVDHDLQIDDPSRTFFTFDCNPTGSDQKYAHNQHYCRMFARKEGIKVFDIDKGIGTHVLIEEGLAYPGSTTVSTDSHANILGAVGCFGQGMGDRDIAAAWANGSIWFKVPPTVRIVLKGIFPAELSAKDIALNLLAFFGANRLLGVAIEIYGDDVDKLSLDDRITISSMATEMGAIILIFPPNRSVLRYCEGRTGKKMQELAADKDAQYLETYELDLKTFTQKVSRPGKPHDAINVRELPEVRIDSAFIGSCTNGRIDDMRIAAEILKGKKIAPGVILKIVPSTDLVWQRCLDEGIIRIFKDAGAMVSNAGCAGCAAGQVGQSGEGEVMISTGNRNFPGKQGRGEVWLGSPAIVAASAVAGFITTPDKIPGQPLNKVPSGYKTPEKSLKKNKIKDDQDIPLKVKGRAWYIKKDNIDTDMIFHNRYLTITDIDEMGEFAFDNLSGYEDFSKNAEKGDIIFAGKNFGSGSSRQQAVDCFKSLGIQAIIAESFGAIYERNAINSAFPVLVCENISSLDLEDGDIVRINFQSGMIENTDKGTSIHAEKFSDVQMNIYRNGGLF